MRRFEDVVLNANGMPVGGVQVTVFLAGTLTPAVLYSDDGITVIGNPVTTNPNTGPQPGVFSFFIASGRYDFQVSGSNIGTYTQKNVEIADIYEFKVTDTQPWVTQTQEFSNQVAGPTPPSGFVNLYSKLVDKNLYYKDDTGREVGPLGGSGGGGQLFDQFNPYVDIRTKSARAVSIVPTTTAITTAGSSVVTLAAAAGFQTGDGIRIDGAGALNTLSTPSAPTVTPAISTGLIGTDEIVNIPAGAFNYQYAIVARTKLGGTTVASAVGSVAGLPTIGDIQVGISSITRLNTTVTVQTSVAHNLVVGAAVWIQGVADGSFNGAWQAASVADSTHFTFTSAWDTRNGAASSSSGGTVDYYLCNHVTWTAVPGAWQYYIYLNQGLIGVSKPGELFYDDWGPILRGNASFPIYVPTLAPITALNDPLVTTITAGGGTTSLTLAAAATTAVTSARTVLDNAPTILAAAQVAGTGVPIYIPSTPGASFVVNSFLDLTVVSQPTLLQAGTLTLNETLALPSQHRWFGDRGGSGVNFVSFNWNGEATVNVGPAYPGVYSSPNGSRVEGLTISSGSDQALLWLDTDATGAQSNIVYRFINWITGNSGKNEDYLGIAYENRGNFGLVFEYNAFVPNMSNSGPTGLWAPHLYSRGSLNQANNAGNLVLKNNTGGSKGIGFDTTAPFTNAPNVVDYWYAQGPRMPVWTFSCPSGSGACNVGQNIALKNVFVDTSLVPILANLGQNSTAIYAENNTQGSGFQFYSGTPVSAFINGSSGGGFPNTGITGPGSGFYSDRNVSVVGNGVFTYGFGTLPAAPSATISAGGSVPTGSHTYTIQYLDINGNTTSVGAGTTVNVTAGNQVVTIAPVNPPAGAVQYFPLRDGIRAAIANTGQGNCNNPGQTPPPQGVPIGQSFIDSFGFTCGNSTFVSGAGPSTISSKGVNTTALNLINSGFTSTSDFPVALSANRNLHVPNASGTFALVETPLTGDLGGTLSNATVTGLHFGSTATPLASSILGGTLLSFNGTNIVGTNNVPVADLNAGLNASSTTFWRGDGTWSTVYSNGGRNTAVCTTPAGGSCITTVNLFRTEPDTNYAVSATCVGPTQFPFILGVTKTTTSVSVTLQSGVSNQAQASTCTELDVVVTR